MRLLNNKGRDRLLFSKSNSYVANFFDDPSAYLQLGDNMYDLADPQTYANAARGVMDAGRQGIEGARQAYGNASDLAGKAWETGKQVVKSLPNIHENTGLADTYLNRMSKVNPKAYAPDMPQNMSIPERLYPPGFQMPDVPFERLSPEQLLDIDAGQALDVGSQIKDAEEQTGLPSRIAGGAVGLLGGLYGTGKAAEVASRKGMKIPSQLQNVYNKLPGINIGNMSANIYMANFAFSAKPILNSTVRKKATDAFNKKMGRLAQSGDLASSDANVRKSALANATKIKERMRKA